MNRKNIEEHYKKLKGVRIAYHYAQNSWWKYEVTDEWNDSVPYNHRDVLPNEVVLDLDYEDYAENERHAKDIKKRLVQTGLLGSVWRTGGKGIHIHLFFKGLDRTKEKSLIKNIIADYILLGLSCRVDRQLMGNHLVRMEYGHHEKALPEEKFKEPIESKNHFYENDVPQECWDLYEKKIVAFAIRRLRWANKKIPYHYETPACVKFISSDEFGKNRDGGKRALFVVASYYHALPDEELAELLLRYNKYNLKKPLPKSALLKIALSVRQHKGRRVGCNYRHQLLEEVGFKNVVELCEKKRGAILEKQEDSHNNEHDTKK